jgi:hypothetical protein
MKYWPIIGFIAQIVFGMLSVWLCWSLRQFAKGEVEKIVNAVVVKLQAKDDLHSLTLAEHDGRLDKLDGQVDEIRKDILDLPTKADIATLTGEIRTVGAGVTAAQNGIERIEGFFLARGVERLS